MSYSCRVPRRQYFTPVGPPRSRFSISSFYTPFASRPFPRGPHLPASLPPHAPPPVLLKEFLRSLSIFNHSSTFHCQWRHLRLREGCSGDALCRTALIPLRVICLRSPYLYAHTERKRARKAKRKRERERDGRTRENHYGILQLSRERTVSDKPRRDDTPRILLRYMHLEIRNARCRHRELLLNVRFLTILRTPWLFSFLGQPAPIGADYVRVYYIYMYTLLSLPSSQDYILPSMDARDRDDRLHLPIVISPQYRR